MRLRERWRSAFRAYVCARLKLRLGGRRVCAAARDSERTRLPHSVPELGRVTMLQCWAVSGANAYADAMAHSRTLGTHASLCGWRLPPNEGPWCVQGKAKNIDRPFDENCREPNPRPFALPLADVRVRGLSRTRQSTIADVQADSTTKPGARAKPRIASSPLAPAI